MGVAEYVAIGLAVMSLLFGVIGYLLSQKDAAQSRQIKDLYDKHTSDEKELTNLKLVVAGEHYRKPEVDSLFAMLRSELREGFQRVETAIHELRNGKDK